MPDMVPVATQIQPLDLNKGISSMSGLLGIQQQKQALQTGQYQQESAQAESQQEQQKAAELKQAQAIAIDGAKSGKYTNSDGSLNRQKMADDISRVAPTFGNKYATEFLSQANEVVHNQQAHQNLTVSQKKEVGDAFGSLAADPQVDNSKVIDTIERLREAHPNDPQFSRLLTSMSAHMPNTANPQDLQSLLGRWSAAATGEPQTTPTQVGLGNKVQGAGQNRFTGALAPSGPGLATGLSPESRLPRLMGNAAGQVVAVNPVDPNQVAPVGSGAAPTGPGIRNPAPGSVAPTQNPNPTTAQASTANTQAAGVAGRVQQAQVAANNSPQAQDALTRARSILDQSLTLDTGAGFEWKRDVKNLLAANGIDTGEANDANSLVKNLARYEASRATQAGLGGTDAARELAHNGSPNVSLDKGALKGIITQSLATEKALSTYANIQAKSQDPAVLAKNEAAFRSIPNLIQGYEYRLARSPQEANEFLRKHQLSSADMKKTLAGIKSFESQ